MIYKNETIVVADTAIGFTASILAMVNSPQIKRATCTTEEAQIRAWEDGTDPTASVGQILNIGDVFEVAGVDAANFRAIRTGSVSGKISVAYEV